MKTTVDKIWFCKGQRVPSQKYKDNYDKIEWDKTDSTFSLSSVSGKNQIANSSQSCIGKYTSGN